MYLPHPFHAVHLHEARRLLELQQIQNVMDKQQCLHLFDSLGPLRQITMADRRPRQPDKPYTSFTIRDILANDDRASGRKKGIDKQTNDHVPPSPRCSSASSSSSLSEYSSDRHCDISWSPGKTVHERNSESLRQRIIRPWCPPSATANGNKNRQNGLKSLKDVDSCLNKTVNKDNLKGNSQTILKRTAEQCVDDEEIDVEVYEDDPVPQGRVSHDISPLGALVAMSTNAFKGLEPYESHTSDQTSNCRSQVPKKKRKTRTAFTNQQIYELEKRFIMQKYLTPADRDEIASKLGLTCAQVITWFQNRRAKFKRDIDEMKKDVVAGSPSPSGTVSETVTNDSL